MKAGLKQTKLASLAPFLRPQSFVLSGSSMHAVQRRCWFLNRLQNGLLTLNANSVQKLLPILADGSRLLLLQQPLLLGKLGFVCGIVHHLLNLFSVALATVLPLQFSVAGFFAIFAERSAHAYVGSFVSHLLFLLRLLRLVFACLGLQGCLRFTARVKLNSTYSSSSRPRGILRI